MNEGQANLEMVVIEDLDEWPQESEELVPEFVHGSRVNPHQLLLAVTAPLIESLNTDARLSALRLMLSLSTKFQQFRVRMFLYDVLPMVVRLALSAGNERIFRHPVAVEERDLARRVVCQLIADKAARQWLTRGWKLAGLLLVVQSYEPVMLGMADDEARLSKSRVWMASSLLELAQSEPANCQPIASKALTVLLSMINSRDFAIRGAA